MDADESGEGNMNVKETTDDKENKTEEDDTASKVIRMSDIKTVTAADDTADDNEKDTLAPPEESRERRGSVSININIVKEPEKEESENVAGSDNVEKGKEDEGNETEEVKRRKRVKSAVTIVEVHPGIDRVKTGKRDLPLKSRTEVWDKGEQDEELRKKLRAAAMATAKSNGMPNSQACCIL